MNDREAELLKLGWTRRFVSAPPRLAETVALYRSLGFEVHLEQQAPDELDAQCQGCQAALGLFKVVYTRPQQPVLPATRSPRARGEDVG
jgi:hypothetical protein